MTRSTHLPSPSPDQIRALLAAQGWTAYRAAQLVGVTGSAMQQACRGETSLRGGLWLLLRAWAAFPEQLKAVADER